LAAIGEFLRREQDRGAGFADYERCGGRAEFDWHGLVEFVGGLMTAVLALCVLLYINAVMTVVAFGADCFRTVSQ